MAEMKFYLAPMEGLTGFVFRNAYQKHFGDIDTYFTPFINNKKMNYKEIKDILPEHNKGMHVVPQILTNRAEDFLAIAKELGNYGYESVNLNLGCPSGTVVTKHRGAGFLAVPEELDHFLEEIFADCPLRISVKTRIGINDAGEWERILSIYEKYPMEELIIHPRVQKDFYNNTPDMDAFLYAVENSRHTLCYNGDICSVDDYKAWIQKMEGKDREHGSGSTAQHTEHMMLGRGILKNPGLVGELMGHAPITKDQFHAFHDDVLKGYLDVMSGERNTLFRMKELWFYFAKYFTEPEKYVKQIKKTQRVAEYRVIVDNLFREQEWQPE
ncbi:tRNA-dihydrouridine synthase family protein [Roseburia sp. OF03-24]|jgi:tRNA-dihydrouridine synthase|uniref:tRNA dihydrouridine synthase n=1 Tax=Roseburia TaxID=841 RepID=UPI000E476D4B|nr:MULTISPECIES: tRNA-dihydrouridine synthase family protein [Roseburia]RGX93915.1 tRNA-dihydrouridine synthase family protein [Roseburia sp. OF03-24]UMZ00874.1 tRNA-dihydrouridine synthase family protein [Roseburia rectibacter]